MASDGTDWFCLVLGLNDFLEAPRSLSSRFDFFGFDFLNGGAIACFSVKKCQDQHTLTKKLGSSPRSILYEDAIQRGFRRGFSELAKHKHTSRASILGRSMFGPGMIESPIGLLL